MLCSGVSPWLSQTSRAWWPLAGTVVLAGGGLTQATSDTLIPRLLALAGGPAAPIVVIPTANPRADSAALRREFEQRGALHVTILNAPDKVRANSPDFVAPLRSAKIVFLTGGQSMTLERAYLGTLMEREIKAVLERGGVLVGDSAGAIAIGCAWLTWLPDPFGKRGDEFCALPRLSVNPHANAARGYVLDDEVLRYLLAHPSLVAVDIDENTFLVLHDGVAEAYGAGSVSILDVSKSKAGPYTRLRSGERIRL